MEEIIELTLDSPDGIIDCRLEPQLNDTELSYSATILYPNSTGGYNRSEVYSHNLRRGTKNGDYYFVAGEDTIPPKINKLEAQLSKAIMNAQHSTNDKH